jgi:hypothetical protein
MLTNAWLSCDVLQANPATLAPYIVRICEAAATPLMGGVRVSRSLQENAALTLGRAAMVCPDQVRYAVSCIMKIVKSAKHENMMVHVILMTSYVMLCLMMMSPCSGDDVIFQLAGMVCSSSRGTVQKKGLIMEACAACQQIWTLRSSAMQTVLTTCRQVALAGWLDTHSW